MKSERSNDFIIEAESSPGEPVSAPRKLHSIKFASSRELLDAAEGWSELGFEIKGMSFDFGREHFNLEGVVGPKPVVERTFAITHDEAGRLFMEQVLKVLVESGQFVPAEEGRRLVECEVCHKRPATHFDEDLAAPGSTIECRFDICDKCYAEAQEQPDEGF